MAEFAWELGFLALQAGGIKKQKVVSLQSLIFVALIQQKPIQCAKKATVFIIILMLSHQNELSRWEIGGSSSDENNS